MISVLLAVLAVKRLGSVRALEIGWKRLSVNYRDWAGSATNTVKGYD